VPAEGYASQNSAPPDFGLGKDPKIEKAVIQWPSGRTQTILAPKAGSFISRGIP